MTTVGYVETRATLAAAYRAGRLGEGELRAAKDAFALRWEQLRLIRPEPTVLRLAGELAEEHGLRGYDALHLASALSVPREEDVVFAAADKALREAAHAEGLTLLATQP